jgi:hypothetical protein
VLAGVDRAALVFAATAGVITLFTAAGNWSVTSSFFGVLLAVLVLAFHRPAPHKQWTVRKILIQVAFGFTLVVCGMLIAAYPLQTTTGDRFLDDSSFVALVLFGGGFILAVLEPPISYLLDLGEQPSHESETVSADPA